MNVQINDDISVNIKATSRKVKGCPALSAISLKFDICEKGIYQFPAEISLTLNAPTHEWSRGFMIGKSELAKLINNNIAENISKAKKELEILRLKDVKSCDEVRKEIATAIKTKITGKAPRGKKSEFLSKLSEHSLDNIVLKYLEENTLSKNRNDNYSFAINKLKEYFEVKLKVPVPPIGKITEENLTAFRIWYKTNSSHKQNTRATYLGMVRTIFKYAVKKRIIAFSPIPDGFTESFKVGKRIILSEGEVNRIKKINDKELSLSQQKAKYSLLLQALTGMGYGDMRNLKQEHILFNKINKTWFIAKDRNKTGHPFDSPFVKLTKKVMDTLIKISDSKTEFLFNLPKISTARKNYKKIALKANINESIATYTLRYTYASIYMEKGGLIEDLQRTFGHKYIKTTQLYGAINQKRLAENIKKIAKKSLMFQT